jgi:hypothetical protein
MDMPNDTSNETSLLYDYEGNLVEEIESEDPMESDAEDSIFYDEDGNIFEGEDEEEGESEEDGDVEEEEEEEEENQESKSKPEEDKQTQGLGATANTKQDVVTSRIKPDFIPGSKEFFDAVEETAARRFKQEMGEEFDEFDPKHLIKFNYFARLEAAEREKEYKAAVSYIQKEEASKTIERSLSNKLDEILVSPELKLKFSEELGKISVSKYAELEKSIAAGDFSGILDLAAKVASPLPRESNSVRKSKKVNKPKSVKLFSDFLV